MNEKKLATPIKISMQPTLIAASILPIISIMSDFITLNSVIHFEKIASTLIQASLY